MDHYKKGICSGSLKEDDEHRKHSRHNLKFEHAIAYINHYAINQSDITAGDKGVLEYIVSFSDVKAFHQEYTVSHNIVLVL